MTNVLISYFSKTGTTEAMAKEIAEGASEEDSDVELVLKNVEEVGLKEVLKYDAIVLGSPTYYGSPAAEIEKFIDESVAHHGKLEGVIGGAFASSANKAGGNETTILSILKSMLVHGMIIKGTPDGDHYGPVVVGDPTEEDLEQCRLYGREIVSLVKSVRG